MAKRKRKPTEQPKTPAAPVSSSNRKTPVLLSGALLVVGVAGIVAFFVLRAPAQLPSADAAEVLASGGAADFDVILVTLDTTRADRIGCYGYAPAATPVIDRLAAEGLRFVDAVTCVPITLPAHASILTGLDPDHHGVRNNGEFHLDETHTSLAEILRDQQYQTAAFVSAFVVEHRFGLSQGFDTYNDDVQPPPGATTGGITNERPANQVTDVALDWYQARSTDQPAFMWVHYFDPHTPYSPPAPFADRFRQQPYDGEIAFMDTQLGRLIDAIEASPRRDQTLLIVVGDHGEGLGDHGEATHSRLIYGATQRVPLILWAPALITQAGVVNDTVVSIVDLFPTVLDLLGITFDGRTDGYSLRTCQQQRDRTVYMETMATFLEHGWAPLHALRRHHDKYILAPTSEYYDLRADPHEQANLLQQAGAADIHTPMNSLADALLTRLDQSLSAAAVAESRTPLDAESLRRLQSLGYLSGGASASEEEDLPDPKDMIRVWGQLGRVKELRRAGRVPQALELAHRLVNQAPSDPTILRELGRLYIATRQFEAAEQTLRRGVSLKPEADVYHMLAQLMINAGRLQEADAFVSQALDMEPAHGGAMVVRGDIYLRLGQPDNALAWYQKALRDDPARAGQLARQRIQTLLERHNGG